jgi:hypothetical protein
LLSDPYVLLIHWALGGREAQSRGGNRGVRWRMKGALASGGVEDTEAGTDGEVLGGGGRGTH